jgi:hypothetical protein
MIKVENESSLARDSVSKAVINTDMVGYETYLQQRERLLAERNAVKQNTQDIQDLKQEIGDIKGMLEQLLKRVS